jgi:quercetin dioxygenase-like cupin family protein
VIQSTVSEKAFGPVKWEDADPPYIYDSGTILRPFNECLNLKSGLLRMSVARLLPGEEVDHHDHYTMSEVYFLMRGKGHFRVDDALIEVEQNTAMYFQPGVMRSVVNNSDEEAWWLFVGSPPDQKPAE